MKALLPLCFRSKRIFLYLMLLISSPLAYADRPNVLFILADDLGYGGLHCYGTDWLETPNIDGLCSEGMKFTDGHAAYPTCVPSRIAILTGQYGPRTGGYRVVDRHRGKEHLIKYLVPKNIRLSQDKITVPECFQQAGYATAAFGKWAVNNSKEGHPLNHGFDDAVAVTGHFTPKATPPITLEKGDTTAEYCTKKACDFMERAQKDEKPFFLYMPYYLVHKPLEARPDYIKHFKKKMKGMELRDKHPEQTPIVAAMTKTLDDCVGVLLAKLRELGIEENTVVVFSSDNGAYNTDLTGPTRGRKTQTYEGGLKVPYIVRWPHHIEAGSLCTERIIGVDLYPTFLAMAGIDPPDGHPLDGVDLTPLLTGDIEQLAERQIYCFYPKYAQFNKRTKRWQDSWRNVIYDGGYKLIEYPEYDEYELFHLAEDPEETTSLAEEQVDRREDLTKDLHQWMKELNAPPLKLNPDYQLENRTENRK